ncbi:MAG: FlgD immunoglobulin-like domain containing protein [Candidatus Latescibacterota bacterium]
MRYGAGLVTVLATLQATAAMAITWNFDRAGDREGWRVEHYNPGRSTMAAQQGSVASGCWFVPPEPDPQRLSLQLVSPRIGHDSALFDRVSVRFRVVHSRPFVSGWGLQWTNVANRAYPGGEPLWFASDVPPDRWPRFSRFWIAVSGLLYTTEWQEVALGELRTGMVTSRVSPHDVVTHAIVWEDTLIDIRLLFGTSDGYVSDSNPGQLIQGLEVDHIILTGPQEMLHGELEPVGTDTASGTYGTLFGPPTYVPLYQPGVESSLSQSAPPGALGDLDGDGDLDLIALWSTEGAAGWLYAQGTNGRSFDRATATTVTTAGLADHRDGGIVQLWGPDLNSDGAMDVVLSHGYTTQLHVSEPRNGRVTLRETQSIEGLWPLGVGDGNGDGRADLWLADFAEGQERAVFGRNDGTGRLLLQEMPLVRPRPRFLPMTLVAHGLGPDGVDGVVWGAMLAPGAGLEVTYLVTDAQVEQLHVPAALDLNLIHYVGDLDGDQDVDLLVSDEVIAGAPPRFLGMRRLLSQADGGILEERLTADMQPRRHPAVADLNRDGSLDVAFVDGTPRDPAVVVALAEQDGSLALEGRYPLQGPGGAVLHGDLDGDGGTDLAVLESSLSGEGGVHLLLNRLSERGTVVAADREQILRGSSAAYPAAPNLLPAFPNPFNPQTTLPVHVPGAAATVDLRVYDTLGRPVRSLLRGSLPSGTHAVIWDGRDNTGREVRPGVYLCRLRAGSFETARKLVLVR